MTSLRSKSTGLPNKTYNFIFGIFLIVCHKTFAHFAYVGTLERHT